MTSKLRAKPRAVSSRLDELTKARARQTSQATAEEKEGGVRARETRGARIEREEEEERRAAVADRRASEALR